MNSILQILNEIRPEFDFASSENFIEDGYIDSFDMVTLISMLEEKYNIVIDALDIVPENFGTLEAIAQVVKKNGGIVE